MQLFDFWKYFQSFINSPKPWCEFFWRAFIVLQKRYEDFTQVKILLLLYDAKFRSIKCQKSPREHNCYGENINPCYPFAHSFKVIYIWSAIMVSQLLDTFSALSLTLKIPTFFSRFRYSMETVRKSFKKVSKNLLLCINI